MLVLPFYLSIMKDIMPVIQFFFLKKRKEKKIIFFFGRSRDIPIASNILWSN